MRAFFCPPSFRIQTSRFGRGERARFVCRELAATCGAFDCPPPPGSARSSISLHLLRGTGGRAEEGGGEGQCLTIDQVRRKQPKVRPAAGRTSLRPRREIKHAEVVCGLRTARTRADWVFSGWGCFEFVIRLLVLEFGRVEWITRHLDCQCISYEYTSLYDFGGEPDE